MAGFLTDGDGQGDNNNYDDDAMISNAHRVVDALQKLGPTFVKFGQALGSRPDIIPQSLAEAVPGVHFEPHMSPDASVCPAAVATDPAVAGAAAAAAQCWLVPLIPSQLVLVARDW